MEELCVAYEAGHYLLLDQQGVQVQVLQAGQRLELDLGGVWCAVRVQSGGYKGWYYEVGETGLRGRFAVGMHARRVGEGPRPVERVEVPKQLAWVGQPAKTRVPMACGLVVGVVREITAGRVVFAYRQRQGNPWVVVSFPVARLAEVLEPVSAVEALVEGWVA